MQCPRCQVENRRGAFFCRECGTRLDAACPSCGAKAELGSKFCDLCGTPLGVPPIALATPVRFASPERYTPRHLAEKILVARATLEGERKQVTVLFADLKGSLELLADRDPEDARAALDPVLERMMEAAHRYEGTVNQVLGDGIMALFGAPLAHEDHAERACYAALRMQESVSRYADELQRSHGVPLQVRVGLHSGEVVVRSIGSDLHTDYVAVGQTVHLAARMEQMAKPGSVLITAETFQQAEGCVRVKPLGPVPVKGLEAPIQIYELVGARSEGSGLERRVARGLSPFVGRQRELDQLERALEQARMGHGQVVAVVGEPGVGKTRLFFEFTRSHRTRGWLTLETRSVSYGMGTTYHPVIDLLKRYGQIDERDSPEVIREKLTERIVALDERLKDEIPPLLFLLEALPEDHGLRSLDPSQRRARTLDALRRLLVRESQRQPLVLVFENLHWVDTESQAFLDRLVDSLPSARLLLLVAYRPDYWHGWGSKTYYTQLPVEPLPPERAEDLLQALLGNADGLEPLRQLLIERTEGNPFFLEESVRALVETGVLAGARSAYRLAKPLQNIVVPPTVQAVLAARIDRLPSDDKRLLQAAAVIGKDAPFTLLQAIVDVPEQELQQSLAHLQAAEFVYETRLFPDLEYTFKHILTQEVTYGSLLQERRHALHARIVDAIERLYSDRLAEQVDRLAYHALRGEVWEKACTYLRQAGGRAAARSANEEAVTCFEQALGSLKHLPQSRDTLERAVDLRFDLRPPLLQLGRLQEVLALSQEAELMAQRLQDQARLARVYPDLINYHYLKGEPDRAIEYGQRCLEVAKAGNDVALQALARRYTGHSYHAQGRYRLAESILRQNVEELEGTPGRDVDAQTTVPYVTSCGWLGFTLAELGEFDLADRYLDQARDAAEASRHVYSRAIAWTMMGLVRLRRGDFEHATEPLARSLELCGQAHLAVWQPIPSSLLGLTLVLLGRLDEGVRRLEEGVTLSEELGVKAYLALWTAHLGEGLLIAGQTERAHVLATRALELARTHQEEGHQAWILQLLGEIASRRDPPDASRAEEAYLHAMAVAHRLGMRPVLARSHSALGRLYQRTGNRSGAQTHLRTAVTLFCEMDMPFWARQAWAELRQLGQLFIVTQDRRDLYDYLTRLGSEEDRTLVRLDRRRGERRRQGIQTRSPERRFTNRRGESEPADSAHGIVITAQP